MAVFPRGGVYWYEFVFAGKRVRKSAKTKSKTIAKECEKSHRRELERSLAGLPAERREDRIKSAGDVVKSYLDHYEINHRAKSVAFANGRLAHVKRLLGDYQPIELVAADTIEQRRAFDELVARQRKQPPLGRAGDGMA